MTVTDDRPIEPRHAIHELNGTGDTKIEWDPANAEEVRAAREHFDLLNRRGYLAYTVNPDDSSQGEQIRQFDPDVRQIVMSPQLQGG